MADPQDAGRASWFIGWLFAENHRNKRGSALVCLTSRGRTSCPNQTTIDSSPNRRPLGRQLCLPISPTSRKTRAPSCSRLLRRPRPQIRLPARRRLQRTPTFRGRLERRSPQGRRAVRMPRHEGILDHPFSARCFGGSTRFWRRQTRPPGYCDRAASRPSRTRLPRLSTARRRAAPTPTIADRSSVERTLSHVPNAEFGIRVR